MKALGHAYRIVLGALPFAAYGMLSRWLYRGWCSTSTERVACAVFTPVGVFLLCVVAGIVLVALSSMGGWWQKEVIAPAVEKRKTRAAARQASRVAAATQDGQLSTAEDALGRLSYEDR
jgi:hypothetical protein